MESPSRALVLPGERAIEARFTGARFARYRPHRGDHAIEGISLTVLSALEASGETSDLIAALASTGDVVRATGLAAGRPVDARNESDRAALALTDGDPERALGHAYRAIRMDPRLPAAWWNLGLAARARGLGHLSRSAFQRTKTFDEPGWSGEAGAKLAALDAELGPPDGFAAFERRAHEMIDGGPPIDVADVQRFPSISRIYVLDALRLAAGHASEPLRPLALALDALSGTRTMVDEADRAAAVAPAVRARFADRYRKVLARTATPEEITQLIDSLRAAGPALDDMRAGAIIAGGQAAARLAELAATVAPWHDPWFELLVERTRIHMRFPGGDLRAEHALAVALATQRGDAWALRVGQLAQDLAQLLADSGRDQDAEPWAARAVDRFEHAGAPAYLETARADLANLHHTLGRTAVARAELEEVILAVGGSNCHLRRFSEIVLATLALRDADWIGVRATLPAPAPPEGCTEAFVLQGIATATDLARQTGDERDREVAHGWITDARGAGQPDQDGVALIATARLARGSDPVAAAAVHEWLASHPATPSPDRLTTRMWGFTTLVTDAGARADWAGVLAVAAFEHPASVGAACRVVASFDDSVLTVAAWTPEATLGDQRRVDPAALAGEAIVPPSIAQALARCSAIAVDARPPLHGRGDFLPAASPWWFASGLSPHTAARRGPAIEVAHPRPPDSSLAELPPCEPSTARFDLAISGAGATPAHVLAALSDASYAELHVHGVAAAHNEDAAFLALSPELDGTFALSAERVRHARLRGAPLVVLAACRAAAVAGDLRERWSLPDAFLAAGASAVVAADVAIPNCTARVVFDELHRRVDAGEPVEAAIAGIRASATGDRAWAKHLMLFR